MTLNQLDTLLAQWKDRTDQMAAVLMELRCMPTWDLLSGTGAHSLQLTGVTAQRVPPAIAALDTVWRDYAALSSTLARAADLRAQMPRFSGIQQKVDEIAALLNQEALFTRMTSAFSDARRVVLDVDSAWKKLDAQLNPAIAFLRENQNESEAGVPELEAMTTALRPRVMPDPLGTLADFDARVAPALERCHAAVEILAGQRREFAANLEAAKATIAKLASVREQNEAVYREHAAKISGYAAPELPLPAPRISQLSDRLTGIGQKELDPVWAEIGRMVAAEEAAFLRNSAPLEMRRELRGRLSALKAKAAARGKAEDLGLRTIGERANALLYGRPTPMDEASALIRQYEAALNKRTPLEPRQ
jgi:hypothetical protein